MSPSMSPILTISVRDNFWNNFAADYSSVLYWVGVSKFCVQMHHIYPNNGSKIRFDPWIQSGETTLNQQLNFSSKIPILGVSIFRSVR
jgi:hypothetical protein